MKQSTEDLEDYRFAGSYGDWNGGHFVRGPVQIRTSNGGGWEHISVSLKTRCPTWEEMCKVKGWCFSDDEVVMQLHPAKSDYRNQHPFCLHLWRPQATSEIDAVRNQWAVEGEMWPAKYPTESVGDIPLPPGVFVALKTVKSR